MILLIKIYSYSYIIIDIYKIIKTIITFIIYSTRLERNIFFIFIFNIGNLTYRSTTHNYEVFRKQKPRIFTCYDPKHLTCYIYPCSNKYEMVILACTIPLNTNSSYLLITDQLTEDVRQCVEHWVAEGWCGVAEEEMYDESTGISMFIILCITNCLWFARFLVKSKKKNEKIYVFFFYTVTCVVTAKTLPFEVLCAVRELCAAATPAKQSHPPNEAAPQMFVAYK